jgi:hypothetical protein
VESALFLLFVVKRSDKHWAFITPPPIGVDAEFIDEKCDELPLRVGKECKATASTRIVSAAPSFILIF